MKLSELIAAVGDDNVAFQVLLNDLSAVDVTKQGTKITFYTDPANLSPHELLPGGKSKKIGLVLWLPRAEAEAEMAKAR
jgi:hypothetical protein